MKYLILLPVFWFTLSFGAELTPIDAKLEGVPGKYSPALIEMLKSWNEKQFQYDAKDPNPVQLVCYETPEESSHIGVRQSMKIEASLARVTEVLDAIDNYSEIFPGYKDIHIVSKTSNLWISYWEQIIPLFFVANLKYKMIYVIEKKPNRALYRYQLIEANHLKSSDGFIVVESLPQGKIGYTEIDFFDGDYGILGSLGPGKIWRESVEGIYLSDYALKLRAENDKKSGEEIKIESKEMLKKFPVQDCLENKKRFPQSKL